VADLNNLLKVRSTDYDQCLNSITEEYKVHLTDRDSKILILKEELDMKLGEEREKHEEEVRKLEEFYLEKLEEMEQTKSKSQAKAVKEEVVRVRGEVEGTAQKRLREVASLMEVEYRGRLGRAREEVESVLEREADLVMERREERKRREEAEERAQRLESEKENLRRRTEEAELEMEKMREDERVREGDIEEATRLFRERLGEMVTKGEEEKKELEQEKEDEREQHRRELEEIDIRVREAMKKKDHKISKLQQRISHTSHQLKEAEYFLNRLNKGFEEK